MLWCQARSNLDFICNLRQEHNTFQPLCIVYSGREDPVRLLLSECTFRHTDNTSAASTVRDPTTPLCRSNHKFNKDWIEAQHTRILFQCWIVIRQTGCVVSLSPDLGVRWGCFSKQCKRMNVHMTKILLATQHSALLVSIC
jgi:hypothetical protein